VALGWPGQWSLSVKQSGTAAYVSGGQETTHFSLLPGEEVRSPLVVVLFWRGQWTDGQNVWRRWMIADNIPKPGGKSLSPTISEYTGRVTVESQFATEENQKRYIEDFNRAGIPLDIWWMDAGWYPFRGNWASIVDWMPDPERFPRGFRPISDLAHTHGSRLMVWFEPERVVDHSWLADNHPEWLLGAEGKNRLLFLGNKDAWQWLVERVSKLITENGIDIYRQDFNFQPLELWRSHDAPDRQGITEIEHVEGYLAYFDELHRRFPNLLIDTCASGGRRLDLETLRRATPYERSDDPYHPADEQAMTYGISYWIPYSGELVSFTDSYSFLSQLTTGLGLTVDPDRLVNENYAQLLKKQLQGWRDAIPYFAADYYPLTSWSIDRSAWIAWQFNSPEKNSGIVEAFRRENSPFDTANFRLYGIDEDASYDVQDEDGGSTVTYTGRELATRGLPVSMTDSPMAKIFVYRRK
jgi:alpha-galactosidase